LASQEIELQQKNEDADKLIHVVGVETEKVSLERRNKILRRISSFMEKIL